MSWRLLAGTTGLDIGWRSRKDRAKAAGRQLEHVRFINGARVSYLPDVMCEAGRFGRKTGVCPCLRSGRNA